MAGGTDMAGGIAHTAARRRRSVHAVVLFVLLLALSWQSFLVGTHAHRPPALSATPGETLHRAPTQDRRPPLAPDSCPICQQISIAAAYLPAPPVDFAAPARAVAWYGARAALDALPRQRSHGWRSRGPPSASIPLS